MAEQILQHEARDASTGVERGQNKYRFKHNREVIPHGEHALAKRGAEDCRHANRKRRRTTGAGE